MLNAQTFSDVAEAHNGTSWTDQQLEDAIEVYNCMLVYFLTRGERLIANTLRRELYSYEDMLQRRKSA
jgi:hypothetical protein